MLINTKNNNLNNLFYKRIINLIQKVLQVIIIWTLNLIK